MPFDPTKPVTNSPLSSTEMRTQLNALNTDKASPADVAAAIAGTANHTPSLPGTRPSSDRLRCGGRESNFLAVIS